MSLYENLYSGHTFCSVCQLTGLVRGPGVVEKWRELNLVIYDPKSECKYLSKYFYYFGLVIKMISGITVINEQQRIVSWHFSFQPCIYKEVKNIFFFWFWNDSHSLRYFKRGQAFFFCPPLLYLRWSWLSIPAMK